MIAYLKEATKQYDDIEKPVKVIKMLYETEEAILYSYEYDRTFCTRLDNLIIGENEIL